MINNSLFFSRLKEECKKIGKSVNQVERELGYARNALNNYKNGSVPSGKRLIELSNYFGIFSEYLIGETCILESATFEKEFKTLSLKKKKELYLICQKWGISYFINEQNTNLQ